jgi:hypothetical protein
MTTVPATSAAPALSGNGRVAGSGYADGDSVDAQLLATRLVLARGAFAISAGWSDVEDEADVIAPWRGFPTAGYTRSMAQYNWLANTESWMIKTDFDFAKAGMVPGMRMSLSYAELDFDDAKIRSGSVLLTDRNVVHIDLVQAFAALPDTEFKLRLALVDAERKPAAADDHESYNELRFEINHLF